MAVLGALRTERYGYTLRKALAEHGMEIDEGTLYPLLRRKTIDSSLTGILMEGRRGSHRSVLAGS